MPDGRTVVERGRAEDCQRLLLGYQLALTESDFEGELQPGDRGIERHCNDPAVSARIRLLSAGHRRCLLAESLMRSAVVIEENPVANDAAGVLQGLEPMPMCALLLQRLNDALPCRCAPAL